MHPPPTRRARRPRVTALLQPQSFSRCPKSKQRAGRARSAKSRLRMPYLDTSARMPTMAPMACRLTQTPPGCCFCTSSASKMRCTMRRELSSAFTATCIDTLGFGETRHAAVRVPFGSLLVQRDRYDTYWGPKKIIFLIREIDDAAMAGASMESCRFVVLRSPRGRLWSVKYMCNRLRRMRGRFPPEIHLPRCISSQMSVAQNAKRRTNAVDATGALVPRQRSYEIGHRRRRP